MKPRMLVFNAIAVISFSGFGCGQERPGGPPTSPKPKTSDARSAPALPPPAPARERSTSGTGANLVDNMEDAVVTGKVRAALMGTQDVQATEINVETEKGVVHLSGVVLTNSDVDRAVYLARQVEGVKAVQHQLRVKSS